MTLNEIEAVAKAIDMAAQLDPTGHDATSQVLARAFLAVLPVVRAVECVEAAREDTSGSSTSYDIHADALWNLHKAAVAMRHSLAGKGKP